MSNVIEIENLSKRYVINRNRNAAYQTLRESLTVFAKNCSRKLMKPFGKSGHSDSQDSFEEFWALKNVSFSIQAGDRVGILGKNGAGKSTLLKVLSRITLPTSGKARIKGRVASLLEVGTGFHPELTGRENVFLNGAILGMSLQEIKQQFDQIVDFAEIEKFLDTPVKRYSSGMYARLAFAIGAHLNPDVLIVDEVLAVGDAKFQEKCFSKMRSMQHEGRSILFVSHSTSAIASICNKGLVLDKGEVKAFGPIDSCLSYYLHHFEKGDLSWQGDMGDEHLRIYQMSIREDNPHREMFYQGEKVRLILDYEVLKDVKDLTLGFRVWNQQNQILARSHTHDDVENFEKYYKKGRHRLSLTWDAGLFHEGEYAIKLECVIHETKAIFTDQIVIRFPVFAPKKLTRFEHGPGPGKEAIFLGKQWVLESSG